MDKQKVAKSLLRMAKSIVGDAKKAKSTTPITADDVKVVFEQFKKITGIKFPNVRFNNAHRKEVESNNGMFKFSLSAGIIIITS